MERYAQREKEQLREKDEVIDEIRSQKEQYKLAFVEKSFHINVLKAKLLEEETTNAQKSRDVTLAELKSKQFLRHLQGSKYQRLAYALDNLFKLKKH